jgi:hypothetical protein
LGRAVDDGGSLLGVGVEEPPPLPAEGGHALAHLEVELLAEDRPRLMLAEAQQVNNLAPRRAVGRVSGRSSEGDDRTRGVRHDRARDPIGAFRMCREGRRGNDTPVVVQDDESPQIVDRNQPSQRLDGRPAPGAEPPQRGERPHARSVEGEQTPPRPEDHLAARAVDLRKGGSGREPTLEAPALRPQHERAPALAPRDEPIRRGEQERQLAVRDGPFGPAQPGQVEGRAPASEEAEGESAVAEDDGIDIPASGAGIRVCER